MAVDSVYKRLARALLNLGVGHIFLSLDDAYVTREFDEDIIPVICLKSSTAAFAAEAYTKVKGLGSFLESNNGGVESLQRKCKDPIPVLCILKEYIDQEANADDVFVELTNLQGYETPLVIMMIDGDATSTITCDMATHTLKPVLEEKKGIRKGNESTFKPTECVVIELVMKILKENLSSEDVIVISDMPGLKTDFPPDFIYEYQRRNGLIGWSVGSNIGYAVASPGKRLITCITDSGFEDVTGELSTLLDLDANSIIIVLNRSIYWENAVGWDYTGVMDAVDNGKLVSWTRKVYTEEQLVKAIHRAVNEEKNKFCVIEVLFEQEDLVGGDSNSCAICQLEIFNQQYLVSYPSCEHGEHIFHSECVTTLFKHGDEKCPVDRIPLAGRRKGWEVKNGKEATSDNDELKALPVIKIPHNADNIENWCSRCKKPYKVDDHKVTLLECSHTYCGKCHEKLANICTVCGTFSEEWGTVIVYEEDEGRVPGGVTIGMINALDGSGRHENEEPAWVGAEADEDRVPGGVTLEMINALDGSGGHENEELAWMGAEAGESGVPGELNLQMILASDGSEKNENQEIEDPMWVKQLKNQNWKMNQRQVRVGYLENLLRMGVKGMSTKKLKTPWMEQLKN